MNSQSQDADANTRPKVPLPPIRIALSTPAHLLYPGGTAGRSSTPTGDADHDHTGAKISLPPMRLYPSRPEDMIFPGRTVDRPQAGMSTSRTHHSRREGDRYQGTREVPSEGHRYVRRSDNELRPIITTNHDNAGRMAHGVAGPNVSAHSNTIGHRGPPLYVQPDARSLALASTPTAENVGRMASMSNSAHTVPNRLQGQSDGPRLQENPQAPRSWANPTSAAPGSLRRGQRFQIPLPADTDPGFKIDIIVFGETGYHLSWTECVLTELHVAPSVVRLVENATMSLDDIIEHGCLQVQGVFYASENIRVFMPKPKFMDPERKCSFTLGHLISLLQAMQSNHWVS
ncbi:hypothetical protein C8Q73DRAFT_284193 [Cubamyces lactineus]|nr:hypothetical protein C8Q73DRAFT_284193 [Cubamyces lactineus]